MFVPVLTLVIVLGNLVALWWLAANESAAVRIAVGLVVAAALGLRLAAPTSYPPGYNPDEIQHCRGATYARTCDIPWLPTADHLPSVSPALFCVPLMELNPRLAIRGYSIVLGALSCAVVCFLCRALELGVTASLFAAACLAVLPWSLFYGRMSIGGDVVFYGLLYATALAGLVWRSHAGWREALLATFALVLSLYDYVWAAQILLLVPLALIPLMPSWKRAAWCVAIVLVGGVAWVPWWRVSDDPWLLWRGLLGHPDPGLYPSWSLPPGTREAFWRVALSRFALFLRCLVAPVAELVIWTQPAVLIHPTVVLVLAAWGVLVTAWRRAVFIFVCGGLGIVPALFSSQASISGHRTLLGIAFVTVAAACGIDPVPWRGARIALAVSVAGLVALQSLSLFVSRSFWPPNLADAFPFPR